MFVNMDQEYEDTIGCIIVFVVWRMGKLLRSNCGTFDT